MVVVQGTHRRQRLAKGRRRDHVPRPLQRRASPRPSSALSPASAPGPYPGCPPLGSSRPLSCLVRCGPGDPAWAFAVSLRAAPGSSRGGARERAAAPDQRAAALRRGAARARAALAPGPGPPAEARALVDAPAVRRRPRRRPPRPRRTSAACAGCCARRASTCRWCSSSPRAAWPPSAPTGASTTSCSTPPVRPRSRRGCASRSAGCAAGASERPSDARRDPHRRRRRSTRRPTPPRVARPGARPDLQGVRAAEVPRPAPGPGLHPRPAAAGGLGLRLLRRHPHRRRPRTPAARQARPRARGADRHRPQRRLPVRARRRARPSDERSARRVAERGRPAAGTRRAAGRCAMADAGRRPLDVCVGPCRRGRVAPTSASSSTRSPRPTASRPLSEHVMLHLRYGGDERAAPLSWRRRRHAGGLRAPRRDRRGRRRERRARRRPRRAAARARRARCVDGARARRPTAGCGCGRTATSRARPGSRRPGLHAGRACCGRCAGRCSRRCPRRVCRRASRCARSSPGADEEAWLAVNAAAFAEPPRAGRLDAGRPPRADGRAVVRPRRASSWPSAGPAAPLVGFHWTKVHGHRGTSTRRRRSARSTSSACDPARRSVGGSRPGADTPRRAAPPAGSCGPARTRCSTSTPTTPPRSGSTAASASPTGHAT